VGIVYPLDLAACDHVVGPDLVLATGLYTTLRQQSRALLYLGRGRSQNFVSTTFGLVMAGIVHMHNRQSRFVNLILKNGNFTDCGPKFPEYNSFNDVHKYRCQV